MTPSRRQREKLEALLRLVLDPDGTPRSLEDVDQEVRSHGEVGKTRTPEDHADWPGGARKGKQRQERERPKVTQQREARPPRKKRAVPRD